MNLRPVSTAPRTSFITELDNAAPGRSHSACRSFKRPAAHQEAHSPQGGQLELTVYLARRLGTAQAAAILPGSYWPSHGLAVGEGRLFLAYKGIVHC